MKKKVDRYELGGTGGRFDFPAMCKSTDGMFTRTKDYEILEKKYRRLQQTVRTAMFELDLRDKFIEKLIEDNHALNKEKDES